MSSAPAYSKEELNVRKIVTEGLKSLVTYSAKHIDTNLVNMITACKSSSGSSELSKNSVKAIQAESQKRLDIYARITMDCLLKKDLTAGTPSSSSGAATPPLLGGGAGAISNNKFTAFTIKVLSEEQHLNALCTLVSGYVKYCDLLSSGAEIYAEPSDEDEDDNERRKARAAMSSEDRNRALLSRTMCEEGRLLTSFITAILFVNRNVKKLEAEVAAQIAKMPPQSPAKAPINANTAGHALEDSDEDEDVLFKTVTIGFNLQSMAATTASALVRAFPNADALVGLLECNSDPHIQLNALRVIGALAESDPIATIPFIAAVENGVSTIGQFVNPERTTDGCGSASNLLLRIQSSAVAVLCELTNPIAIDAAQKADAAAAEEEENNNDSAPMVPSANTSMNGDADGDGNTNSSNNNNNNRGSLTWLGMSGTLQRIIQGALVFDDCLKHLFALAASQKGAFAKDEIAAQLSETVAKTAMAVPLMVADENGGVGSLRSPHPSVARNEGSLALVRKIATVISNVLKNNHQTTNTFLQMGYLEQCTIFLNVPPPFAAQCGDENLAPLPFYARNKGTRSASSVPSLGMEQLLPISCDIILQCLETGAHDQSRLQANANTSHGNTPAANSAASSLGGSFSDLPPMGPSMGGGGNGPRTAPSAQMCLDQLFYRSQSMRCVLHLMSLLGSCVGKSDMITLTSSGVATFRQLTRIVYNAVGLVKGQTRSCIEWLLRNDAISPSCPITPELCTGYYGAALLPLSPAAMANLASMGVPPSPRSPMSGGASSSAANAALGGGGGRTALASIVEDVCLRLPARGDGSAMSLLSLFLSYSSAVASSSTSSSTGGSTFGVSMVDLIASAIVVCTRQPNATPQALGIRQLATAILPLLAPNLARSVGGRAPSPGGISDGEAESPTRGSPTHSHSSLGGGSNLRAMTTVRLMGFLGDDFLPSLLAIPEPAVPAATAGSSSPQTSTLSPAMTPRGSIVSIPPSPMAGGNTTNKAANVPAVALNPSSGTAAAMFCLGLLEAVAALEGSTDSGCGLGKDELALLETAVMTKAAAFARGVFTAPLSPTAATGAAASPAVVLPGSGVALRPTAQADRLLAWLLLANLQHHNFSGRCDARVQRCVVDILTAFRHSSNGTKGKGTHHHRHQSSSSKAPLAADDGSETSTTSSSDDSSEEDDSSASSSVKFKALGQTRAGESPQDEEDDAAAHHHDDDEDDDLSTDILGLLIDLLSLCGGGVDTASSSLTAIRRLLSASDEHSIIHGSKQVAALLSSCLKALQRSYSTLTPPASSASPAQSPLMSARQQQQQLAAIISITAEHSPFVSALRLIRAMCYAVPHQTTAAADGNVGGLSSLSSTAAGGRRTSVVGGGGRRGSVAGSIAMTNATSAIGGGGGGLLSAGMMGVIGGGSSSSASSFLVMRDVVLRYVQMRSHSDDDDDSDADGDGADADGAAERAARLQEQHDAMEGVAKAERAQREADTAAAKHTIDAHKKANAALHQKLAAKDADFKMMDAHRLQSMAAAAVALLARRRRRVEMMFPELDDVEDSGDDLR